MWVTGSMHRTVSGTERNKQISTSGSMGNRKKRNIFVSLFEEILHIHISNAQMPIVWQHKTIVVVFAFIFRLLG